jgi:hypothetical protein
MAGVRITVFGAQAIAEALKLSTPARELIAEEIAADARSAAPVLTGQYRNGIHVQSDGDHVAVVDEDPEAGFKEYGTSDTPAHAVLTDAARKRGKYSGITPRRR